MNIVTIEEQTFKQVCGRFSGFISQVERICKENTRQPEKWLSGREVCALLGISRWTLNERLRPAGTSFSELLKQSRLRLACRLLVESDQSISQISERVCFSSQAVFSRFFSSHLGMTPLGYRQRYGQRR